MLRARLNTTAPLVVFGCNTLIAIKSLVCGNWIQGLLFKRLNALRHKLEHISVAVAWQGLFSTRVIYKIKAQTAAARTILDRRGEILSFFSSHPRTVDQGDRSLELSLVRGLPSRRVRNTAQMDACSRITTQTDACPRTVAQIEACRRSTAQTVARLRSTAQTEEPNHLRIQPLR